MSPDGCWKLDIRDPLPGRLKKPREKGLTMVLDKGLGIDSLTELLEIAHDFIDYIKFSFGTSFIFPGKIMEKKIKLLNEYNIYIYPGGTLFEIAASQNKIETYFLQARELGFTAIEISNGTLEIETNIRKKAIKKARELGFKVLAEVGKKDRNYLFNPREMVALIKKDLTEGADKVIIEGRESGRGISIYREDGSIDRAKFEIIIREMQGFHDQIIWEAPLKKQQVKLIKELGPNVNLGNINPEEVIALEALRRGLRGDTFGFSLQ